MSGKKVVRDKDLVFAPPQHDISGIIAMRDISENVLQTIQEGFVVHEPNKTISFIKPTLPVSDASATKSVVAPVDSVMLYDVVVDVAEDTLEEMLRDVIAKVKTRIGEIDMGNVSLSTLPLLIRIVMEAVEHTIIKGNAQKVFAMRVISELIAELPESIEKGFLKATCESGGIEGTIDLVVAASKGELDVNKVASVALNSCAPQFLGYVRAKMRSCTGGFKIGSCKCAKKDRKMCGCKCVKKNRKMCGCKCLMKKQDKEQDKD
jgi:hypothetical protein